MGCGASSPGAVAPHAKEAKAAKDAPPPGVRMNRRQSERRPGVSAETASQHNDDNAGPSEDNKAAEKQRIHRSSIRKSARASVTLGTNAVIAQYEKSASSLEILKKATHDNPLFAPLNEDQLRIVYGAFVEEEALKGETIILQGDRGDLFYVVESGEFDAYLASSGKQSVKHYETGTGFGELALLYNSPRAATIRCTKKGILWAIDRAVFNIIMVASNQEAFSNAQSFLKTEVDMMGELSDKQIEFLASVLEETTYSAGEKLWDMGTPCDEIFFVRDGDLEMSTGDNLEELNERLPKRPSFTMSASSFREKKGLILRRGDWYGGGVLDDETATHVSSDRVSWREAQSPRGGDGRAMHLTTGQALTRVTALRLRMSSLRSATEQAIGDVPQLLADYAQKKAEAALDEFLQLQPVQRLKLLKGLPWELFSDGASIVPKGGKGTVQLVVRGNAQVQEIAEENGDAEENGEEDGGNGAAAGGNGAAAERRASKSSSNGESQRLRPGDCVDPERMKRKRSAFQMPDRPVAAVGGDAHVVELDADMLIGLSAIAAKVFDRRSASGSEEKVSLDELTQMGILGAGGYGYVSLVQQTSTGQTYALKKMSKPHIVAKRQVDHVNNERKLLSICSHPFLVALYGSFQDASNIYLLLELVLGGELFSYLDDNGPVGEESARFYSASVACALEYLHDQHIVYRDLKPENLLFDSRGHIKVVDFGFAKVVYSGERTWTLCGTPEYLAPEVILRKGHDTRVDWWSLGILIVELISGGTPFYSHDHFDIFKKIVRCDVDYSSFSLPPDCEDLVRQLLVTDPSKRLGGCEDPSQQGHDIRNCKFYKPLDFIALAKRELKAPYVPYIESDLDTRHCPSSDEVEQPDESFLKKNPGAQPEKGALDHHFPEFEFVQQDDWQPNMPGVRES